MTDSTPMQTFGLMLTFILAMALHPDKQKKAQEEIDRVIEDGRLPDLADRASLPYVNAILKEVTRWQVILPLST